jgi:alpha-1,6-mannosyltransferase
VFRLLAVAADPLLSTDVYRYVWDGRVQGAGINPYAYVPAAADLAGLRDTAIYPNINRAAVAVTAYPPVAQMFFFLVTRIAETATTMRLALVACEIVTVAAVIDLLRRFSLPAGAVAAYAWHPLAIWEIANNGHVDALMVALVMLGVWLVVRVRPLAGAVAVAFAALVKPYAVLVLPAFWRPWDWRTPAAVIATAIVCYLPYLGVGSGVFGYLGAGYLAEEGLTPGGDGFWLVALVQAAAGTIPGLTAFYLSVAFAVLGGLALHIAFRADRSPQDAIRDMTVLLMTGLFFVSPNYAWYFLILVPFLAFGGGAPAWTMTLGAFLLYRPYLLPNNDLAWKTITCGAFLVALAIAFAARWHDRPKGVLRWET